MRSRIILIFLVLVILFANATACRMIGLQALVGENLGFSAISNELDPFLLEELEAFRQQGGSGPWPYNNLDGWGILSFAGDNTATIVRSAIEAYADESFYESTTSLLQIEGVKLLIGHLRQTSSGATGIENPHPFHFVENNGVEYTFAHNGDINRTVLRQIIGDEWLNVHPPQTYGGGSWNGDGWVNVVDSELFFFWIIKNIQLSGDVKTGIQTALTTLEQMLPNHIKNFLLSDGSDLYAYRSSPGADIHYFDVIPNGSTPEFMAAINHRGIMSTPPESGAAANLPWTELANHNLLIFRGDGSTEIQDILVATTEDQVLPETPRPSIQAYPNPFNGKTSIKIIDARPGNHILAIYDLNGTQVFSGSQNILSGGKLQFQWSGTAQNQLTLPSGQYLYQIKGPDYILSGKVLLIK